MLVLGRTGSGKSFRLRNLLQAEPRAVILDSLGDPELASSFEVLHGFGALVDRLIADPPVFRVVLRLDSFADMKAGFDHVARAAMLSGNLVLAVEEIGLYASPHEVPLPLERIVTVGRHRNVSLYATSQTPSQLPPLLRSQATRIVSFSQTEPLHIAWCRAVMGRAAEELPALAQGHCVDWRPGSTTIRDDKFIVIKRIDPHGLTAGQEEPTVADLPDRRTANPSE